MVSLATGDQWVHETLYRSRKGRWYVVTSSQWQGSTDSAEFVDAKDAARWLMTNEYPASSMPAELATLVGEIVE